MQHFMEDMRTHDDEFSFLFLNQDKILRIQLQRVQRDAIIIIIKFSRKDTNSFLVTFSLLLSSLLFKRPNDVIVKMVYYYRHLFFKVKAVMKRL